MNRRVLSSIAFVLSGAGLIAASPPPTGISAPTFQQGDTWVFDRAHEQGSAGYKDERIDLKIESVNSDSMSVGYKPDGAPQDFQDHLMGLDWSQSRVFDEKSTITSRPFSFPMSVGASWSLDFTDPRQNGNRLSDHVHLDYKAVGWEDVTTPAGVFHALKIEANGLEEVRVLLPASAGVSSVTTQSGAAALSQVQRQRIGVVRIVLKHQIFYAPSVKYYAKIVQEQYNADGVRTVRDTDTLVSFKPGA
jgi:hypothetical protein